MIPVLRADPVTTEQNLIGKRAELLARVNLTRRMNVTVHPFDVGGADQLDLICTIRDDTVKGFLPFGVLVWGTAKELAHGGDVSPLVRQRLKAQDTKYFLPVIILVFSMHNDAGFFSWLAEPDRQNGKLVLHTKPIFRPFTSKHLDTVVGDVVDWYQRMGSAILAVDNG
jgi:hypothetical protein